jgi:hypothetical protein
MAVQIPYIEDTRADEMLKDPSEYYRKARQEIHEKVQQQIEEERAEEA